MINIGVLLVGIVFLTVGIIMLTKQLKSKKHNTATASATVVAYEEQVSHDADTGRSVSYFPVMRYWAGGIWQEKRSDVGRGRKLYEIGQVLDVLYDPEHPENFIIAGDKSTAIVSVVIIIVGLGVCVLSLFAI